MEYVRFCGKDRPEGMERREQKKHTSFSHSAAANRVGVVDGCRLVYLEELFRDAPALALWREG